MNEIDFSISRTNLYEQIAEKLEQAILHPDVKLAQRLPSEQELARQFSVSRTVIREALKLLRERGLITQKNGGGSYVSKPNTDTISNAVSRIMCMDRIDNDDLHAMRNILELAGGRLAAARISDADLQLLEQIIESMRNRKLPLEERLEKDAQFHITIARASGNELLARFVEVMTILLHDYMAKGVLIEGGIEDGLQRHAKILEVLRTHDPDAVEFALREHLSVSRENVGRFDGMHRTIPGISIEGPGLAGVE